MTSICLLTDGSVQFPSTTFLGFDHIHVINPEIIFEQQPGHNQNGEDKRSAIINHSLSLKVPELQEVCESIASLSEEYDVLIAILAAREINPQFDVIEKAVNTSCGRIKGQVIDSKAFSSGLGFLLEIAAKGAAQGRHPDDVVHLIRSWIPHVFSTLSTPGWAYLQRAGLVDHAQAAAGDILGLQPVFTLEESGLSPIQKVKADHLMFESFQAFLDEFDDLEQITFLYHDQIARPDADLLFDHVKSLFPTAIYSEIPINNVNAAIFGPKTSCLTVVEKNSA